MILLDDAAAQALFDDLRKIAGTEDLIAALTLARRSGPDLYRIVRPNVPPSRWFPTPPRKLKPSDGNATLEYAYVQ